VLIRVTHQFFPARPRRRPPPTGGAATISTNSFEEKTRSDDANSGAIPARRGQFQKGNPGRLPGQTNKRTQFLAAIGKANADEIVKKAVECAKQGKPWAIEAVLAQLFPPSKGRAVTFPMADIRSLEDVAAAYAGLWAAVSQGLLTPDEAALLSGMLKDHAMILSETDVEARLARLEAASGRRMHRFMQGGSAGGR
jgi:hypothetical protein